MPKKHYLDNHKVYLEEVQDLSLKYKQKYTNNVTSFHKTKEFFVSLLEIWIKKFQAMLEIFFRNRKYYVYFSHAEEVFIKNKRKNDSKKFVYS